MEAGILRDSRIAFIGAGNMAEALVKGMVASAIIAGDHIHVSDIDTEKLNAFRANYSVETDSGNSIAAEGAAVCIFAVKPQVLPEVLADTVAGLDRNALVVSIAAGIPTARIESILPKGQRVVRVMPNTPALIGMGISAICPGTNATEDDVDLTEILMGTVGKTVRVSESEMDAVTAVSGSGPAYQFFLLENMIAAGVEMGLPGKTARELACATAEGAIRLMIESGADAGELRSKVTSKGGTTAAAIEVMESNRMDATIIAALKAARNRSIELAEQ